MVAPLGASLAGFLSWSRAAPSARASALGLLRPTSEPQGAGEPEGQVLATGLRGLARALGNPNADGPWPAPERAVPALVEHAARAVLAGLVRHGLALSHRFSTAQDFAAEVDDAAQNLLLRWVRVGTGRADLDQISEWSDATASAFLRTSMRRQLLDQVSRRPRLVRGDEAQRAIDDRLAEDAPDSRMQVAAEEAWLGTHTEGLLFRFGNPDGPEALVRRRQGWLADLREIAAVVRDGSTIAEHAQSLRPDLAGPELNAHIVARTRAYGRAREYFLQAAGDPESGLFPPELDTAARRALLDWFDEAHRLKRTSLSEPAPSTRSMVGEADDS